MHEECNIGLAVDSVLTFPQSERSIVMLIPKLSLLRVVMKRGPKRSLTLSSLPGYLMKTVTGSKAVSVAISQHVVKA